MLTDDIGDMGLTWVGRPMEVVRVLDPVYLDQAEHDFREYVRRTLAGSQAAGGRFNPPGEFGAIYTASDTATAWEEVAARFRRQGVPGLPPEMGFIGILITVGRFADLTDADTAARWDASPAVLTAQDPTPDERDICWAVGRAVRAVGDFLRSPSARGAGANIPIFADRERGDLRMEMQYGVRQAPPEHLRQHTNDPW